MSDDSKVVTIAGKRRPPNAGKGRKPGVPNRVTAGVRNMILGALDDLGGQAWLTAQAKADPRAFMALLARILPSEVSLDARVENVEPIHEIRRTIVDPRAIEQEQTP